MCCFRARFVLPALCCVLCACGALDGPAAETPVRAGVVTHNCARILQRLAWYIIETELFLNQQCCCVESVYGTKCTSSSCLFLLFLFPHHAGPFCGWEKRRGKKHEWESKKIASNPPLQKQREAANYLTSPSSSVCGE